MKTIKINCEQCNETHKVERTPEIPDSAISMGCNWCPCCEANDYYNEWYNESDKNDNNEIISDDPNQLCMPFIIDEILEPELQIH